MPSLGNSDEHLVKLLQLTIRISVRILAILMTILILLGVVDVGFVLFKKALTSSPRFVLSISDILATFGAFMAVLIAIEIFVNIIMYLREDVIHVKIVVATALMAIARKVIILDFSETSADFVWAIASVILATSTAYWLLSKAEDTPRERPPGSGPASQPNPPPAVEFNATVSAREGNPSKDG